MSLTTKASIHAILSADPTFTGLMTGGIHYEQTEISEQKTPAAYDANKEILPCCLIRTETKQNFTRHRTSGRIFILLVFYQRIGYSTIDQASIRARQLLHDQVFPSHGLVEVLHVDQIPDGEDTALRCSMYMDRYEIVRNIVSA